MRNLFRFLHRFKRVFLIKNIDFIKTVRFKFHYFSFRTALKIPVYVYKATDLYRMQGNIVLDVSDIWTGMVKLGPHGLGTRDRRYERTMWEVYGTVIVKGIVNIGSGTRISVGEKGCLVIGPNFCITGGSEIICQNKISFGEGCLISWDVLLMDTDHHHILDNKDNTLNEDKAINIGNHVWIGCRNTILKGISIADNIIIAACSVITHDLNLPNCIVGGHGENTRIIKEGVNWGI